MAAKVLGTQPLHHHGFDYVEGAREEENNADNRNVMADVTRYLPQDAVQGCVPSFRILLKYPGDSIEYAESLPKIFLQRPAVTVTGLTAIRLTIGYSDSFSLP